MNADNPPSPPLDAARRLVAVEERLTFQQRLIDQLNEVVLVQRVELERLARETASLRAAVEDLSQSSPGENLPYEKPPHY